MSKILQDLSKEELIARLMAAQKANAGKVTCKVSAKGALSVYGFGRWPVTLYASQWRKLIENLPTIEAALTANAATLAEKE